MSPRPSPSVTPRTPRRDALRNDAIVVNAARAVFAEQGPQASMEAIAARAGLGVGTIYRRFAGKDALLDAIARLFVEEMDRAAATALEDPDPAAGLEWFLDFVGTFNAEKRRYAASLTDRVPSDDDVSARTADRVRQLTQNAVESGYLTQDATGDDIKALIVAIRGVVATSPEGDDGPWRRFVRIYLAGLRAD
ncbi:TetR/AcrR family transcriptional regulator [Streptomyces tendae]|uniref:TetR/AcrR family transcriptional regulator n=1 Tax=Streptomyces tendae TaxID=1932 RepID=UPI001679021B|nr:TetR/AcrR family transcriptional regulator [Streptomyces tendae]GHB03503.1 putative transcriptional regulator, TetR family protein [Streptomyces tendae]